MVTGEGIRTLLGRRTARASFVALGAPVPPDPGVGPLTPRPNARVDRPAKPGALVTLADEKKGRPLKVSVFGLGYVGCVSAACLAELGHTVVGVDVNPTKVDLINRGVAPVVEERIGELTERAVRGGRLRATTDVAEAMAATEISLVCVGTPRRPMAVSPLCTWSAWRKRSVLRWPERTAGTP